MLDQQHVAPEALDGRWSDAVTQSFITKLDSKGLFFTQADLEAELKEFANLEGLIKDDACGFISRFNRFLAQRIQKIDTLLVSFSQEDVIGSSSKPSDIGNAKALALDLPDLEKRWIVFLKNQAFERKYLKSTEEELEALDLVAVFEQVVSQERCKLSKKLQIIEDDDRFVSKAFFNAMATAYDPHTNYFGYGLMELMAAFMEDKEKSFGFHLMENEQGEIAIGRLLPGGPAWRSNQLHVGDVVTRMLLPDGSEVDFACASLADVKRAVGKENAQTAELTVLSKVREEKTVKLTKEKIAVTDNAVRGYVLNGPKKLGYISLPDFYTSEGQDAEERGCARDVAREIFKLQRDNIEGLILDLRNNGGGSLQEALELLGIFIEEGPLALLEKKGKLRLIRDKNRGAVYFGPLIVLVNGQSASASELVAATLQDYNRALIVGDKTFGKAVGQIMFPVGKILGESLTKDTIMAKMDPAIVKVTTSRIFRLKGESYQQEGIVPDVHTPELLENNMESESDYLFAITSKAVERDTYFKPYPQFPLKILRQKHLKRLNSSGFMKVNAVVDSIRQASLGLVDYDVDTYMSLRGLKTRKEELLQSLINENTPYKALNHSFDKTIINIDVRKKEVELMTLKILENNLYVRSAYHVMIDLINSTN